MQVFLCVSTVNGRSIRQSQARAHGGSRGGSRGSGSGSGISVVAVVVGIDAAWSGSARSTGRSSPACKSHPLPTFTVSIALLN